MANNPIVVDALKDTVLVGTIIHVNDAIILMSIITKP